MHDVITIATICMILICSSFQVYTRLGLSRCMWTDAYVVIAVERPTLQCVDSR